MLNRLLNRPFCHHFRSCKFFKLVYCHATDGPPKIGPPGPSVAIFLAIDGPPGPSMAPWVGAMGGPPWPQMVPLSKIIQARS